MESTEGHQGQKDVDGGIPEFQQAAHEADATSSDTEAELLRNMASMKVSEEGPPQFLGTGFIYDELMTKHKCEWDENYQECPERLLQPFARCEKLGLVDRCVRIPITYATEDQILWRHSSSALEIMKTTPAMTPKEREDLAKNYDAWFGSSATFECSMAAAGSSIDLVDHILKKKVTNGFAMIRPPGHHAMHDEYCGYCTFNNVAIAATHALNSGIERILIVDWDVHHGQATQYMFYDDPRVIYFSIHRYEYGTFWPYLRECDYDFIGEGPGKGYNINVPLNKIEMGDADYVAIFQNVLLPIAYEFSPQLVIISSGYDAAIGCPEGEMLVTPAAYAHFVHMLSALCEGRVCTVLEGGYCIQSLAEGCALTVRSLLGDPCPLLPPLGEPSDSIITTILNVIKVLRPYWKCLQASQLLGPGELCSFEEVNSNPPREGVKFYTPETRPKEYPITGFYHVQTPEVIEGFKQKINHLIRETSLAKAPHKVCFVFDADMRKHSNTIDSTHPERPNRISSIFDKHNEWGLLKRCLQLESRLATEEEILAVHSKEYLEDIVATESMKQEELSSRPLDKNYNSIYISQDTNKCAWLAVGSALQVVECVLSGQAQSGVAVVRPPGHHAEYDKAMGFCFFNNVAIAAAYAKKKFGLNRILIVDWDVHHGNGTQNSFYDDRSVLYLSLHRYENASYFPDKEDADYTYVGGKNAEGYNVNIPWSQERMGNGDYMAAFQRIVMPIAYQFAPELILVSAGFDAAHGDPLGGYHVMPECYGQMTHMLKGLANGRIILVLEGGYNLQATAESFATCTSVLLGDPCPPLEFEEPNSSALKTIQQVVETQKAYWTALKAAVKIPDVPPSSVPFGGNSASQEVSPPTASQSSPCPAHVSPEVEPIRDANSEDPPKSADLKEQTQSKGDSETQGSKPERSADISQMTDEDKKSPLNQQPEETCPDCAQKASYQASEEGAEGINQTQQKDISVKSLESEMAAMDVCACKRDWRPQTVSDVLRMQGVEQLYAVQPLPWCPHLNSVQPLPQEGLDTHAPCQDCGDLKENWVCLTCYKVMCSRFVQEHMASHSKAEGHPLVLSYRDLSVWCYDCNEYVDNKITHPMKNAAHEDKFGETLPETA